MLAKAAWLGLGLFATFLFGALATPHVTSFDVAGADGPILPLSARVIVEHYRSSCGGAEVPFLMDGRIALMCNFIDSVYRHCLGSRRPMFIGRKCRGQRCVFDFTGPNAICLYRSYGQPVHPSNETLASTCGLETDDPSFDVRTPRPLPPLGESMFKDPELKTCGHWLPEGISGVEWTECVEGVPFAKFELTFEKKMPVDVDYHCFVTPTCSKMDYMQHVLCYVDLEEVYGGMEHSDHLVSSQNMVENGDYVIRGDDDISNGVAASPVFVLHKVLSVIFVALLVFEFTFC